MVLVTLLSALGSGAVASVVAPGQTEQNPVAFVSQPVVQPLPNAEASAGPDAADDDADNVADPVSTDASDQSASSLSELVSDVADNAGKLDRNMKCLAGAVYFEARGETLEGQLAVARVIVNRTSSGRFPTSYCGVVLQPSQFSFVRHHSLPHIDTSSDTWSRAVAIARIADQGTWKSAAKGALFFHATSVSPRWGLTKLAQVDNHIFYR
ncbi:cell wall hydrolase [Novosphingobium sp. 9]|uniref:cell wall hydrolase n=1 Tax=Novosphingobium sp. 9 TaxID=2025349 RepID=UPI0021B4EF71|nr:cell wall hydrolase [Novosphingobium sp. 9]